MNKERLTGICLQLAGRASEAWGEWSGDSLRVAAARRDQARGKEKQVSGMEREQSARQLRDFWRHNRNWHF